MVRRRVIHKHHRSILHGNPRVIQISGEYTRCGEYAYGWLSTTEDSKVTCKRCLKGMAKDSQVRNSS